MDGGLGDKKFYSGGERVAVTAIVLSSYYDRRAASSVRFAAPTPTPTIDPFTRCPLPVPRLFTALFFICFTYSYRSNGKRVVEYHTLL